MSVYHISLFLHITGALGFFIGLGLEWVGLMQLRRAATARQVRVWLRMIAAARRVGMPSMGVLLVSGIYMMATVWGPTPWILVTLGTLILLAFISQRFGEPGLAAINQAIIGEDASLSPTLQDLLQTPGPWITFQIRAAIGLGIIFLMTTKPGLSGSLLTIVIATIFGLLMAVLMQHHQHAQKDSAAEGVSRP